MSPTEWSPCNLPGSSGSRRGKDKSRVHDPGTSELGRVRMHNMPTLEKHYTVAVCDLRAQGWRRR